MLEVGQEAPDFTVSDHEGHPVTLSKLRGQSVLLYFYPKADTPGCTIQGCAFRDHLPRIERKDTRVLGISFDTVAENAAFAEKYRLNFPLLCDTERSVGLAYGACDGADAKYARRIAYLIDIEGKVRHVWPKAEPAQHPVELLEILGG